MSINVLSPVNFMGYGIFATNTLLALEKIGQNPALWPIGNIEVENENREQVIKMMNRRGEGWNPLAPSLRIYHQFSLAEHIGKGKRCAYTFFELDELKSYEIHHLAAQDIIFVSSVWAKKILENYVQLKDVLIYVVHPGVNHEIFYPEQPQKAWHDGPTIFLNIGKWEVRKGHYELLQAFNKAFEPTDNVKLIMNCHNPCFQSKEEVKKYNSDWTGIYKKSKMGSKIDIIESRLPTHRDVAELMRSVDCGIFPAKAEGWNLELAEMMAMGKQVICTDYSAHREYAKPDNAHLIEITKLEKAYDGIWFNGECGNWANLGESQIDSLVVYMRHVHERKQERTSLWNQSGYETMKNLTWENTATQIMDSIV